MEFVGNGLFVGVKNIEREGKSSLSFVTLSDGFQSTDFMMDNSVNVSSFKKGDRVVCVLTFDGKYSKITSILLDK